MVSEGAAASEVIERPDSYGFKNTSNLNKLRFNQQASSSPSGITSSEVEKVSKMPKMIDLASTNLKRSDRLANKPKQKYNLFHRFLLSVIVACEVAKKSHIFITRANQHT